ncbi:uncharacterized protein A4U43_C02F18870 [Asparagus officinalis]|uniref:Bifunctional inhibitor/plant lipid transfer protein/seed storage helical domain-containing protein n=1 Tax=Asparagus officinalis TaxID=4686 RepID=A0A5P1FJF2_ASPOF|nr:uncharacterized protein LOC109831640 [Asparagus officinalis]ONK78446.1 uncharacterized protein A4U43_C02F18870 [Asparagus officinalis]
MAKLNILIFLALAIVASSLFTEQANADCNVDLNALSDKCTKFVKKGEPPVLPSDDCCRMIQKADAHCVCTKITPDLENTVSMPLAIMAASFCGNPAPHGTICGSVKIP